jgi:hypothetical protein
MTNPPRMWDAPEGALVLMDFQPEVIGIVFEQDRGLSDLNCGVPPNLAVGECPIGVPEEWASSGEPVVADKTTSTASQVR